MNPFDHDRAEGSSKDADAQPSPVEWARHNKLTGAVLNELSVLNRRRQHRQLLAGAGMAVLIVVGVAFSLLKPPVPGQPIDSSATVLVVGPMLRKLPDGTRVEEKEGTQLTVLFDEKTRRVILSSGAAHFQVSPDPTKPFVVEADGAIVRALGTAFCVQVDAAGLDVLVTEGTVSLAPPAGTVSADSMAADKTPAMLSPGQRVTVSPSANDGRRVMTRGGFEPGDLTEYAAWKAPRLKFSRTPLSDVVTAFNRHNRTRLVIGDESLANLELSGTLQANRLSAILSILRSNFEIETEEIGANTIVLRRAR